MIREIAQGGAEKKEVGKNVTIDVKFIRHGERDKEGRLLEMGRRITRERARESGIKQDDYTRVKAGGSNVKPKNDPNMPRSLETAHIYVDEIAGDDKYRTRPHEELNFMTFVNKPHYDHTKIYNSYLPDNFDDLPDDEKIKAAKVAQRKTLEYSISIKTPEAKIYKDESAGSHAFLIERFARMAKRLEADEKILKPEGTHGGTMEFLLQRALIRKDENGNDVIGFENLDDIGGEFDPSEVYTVRIQTDENGELKDYKVIFDNPARPQNEDYKLDKNKVKELSEYYRKLHEIGPEYAEK